MVRTYKRKTERSNISEETVKSALNDILNHNKNIRQTAKKYGLSTSMLQKRFTLFKRRLNNNTHIRAEDFSKSSLNVVGRKKFNSRQIFSDEEEKQLCQYLIKGSEIHCGLTNSQARKLAYEYSLKQGKIIPKSWINNKTAGIEWIRSFTKRNSWRGPSQEKILDSDEDGIATHTPKVISPTNKIQARQFDLEVKDELVTTSISHIKVIRTVYTIGGEPVTFLK